MLRRWVVVCSSLQSRRGRRRVFRTALPKNIIVGKSKTQFELRRINDLGAGLEAGLWADPRRLDNSVQATRTLRCEASCYDRRCDLSGKRVNRALGPGEGDSATAVLSPVFDNWTNDVTIVPIAGDWSRKMIYVRSALFGLFVLVMSAIVIGLLNFIRRIIFYIIIRPPSGFQMSWDFSVLLEWPLLWVLEFLVFAAGFYWEFCSLSN